ncbi:MAG: hypothetical protein RIT10_511 [Bacteroidota bacterium]|jgi:hypothetical protein
MTLAEAKIILGIDSYEDAFDAFEEQLFALKQFFVAKPILHTTFRAKQKKLIQLQNAVAVFEIDFKQPLSIVEINTFNDTKFSTVFEQFQLAKNNLKLAINSSNNPIEISALVERLIELATNYYRCWKINATFDTSAVILSKEPDPMELLAAIHAANSSGINTFEELAENLNQQNEAISILQLEAARCSMIYEKEKGWMKS